MCGFVTPLQGPEADEHGKPEVAETEGTTTHLPPVSPLAQREGPAQLRIE